MSAKAATVANGSHRLSVEARAALEGKKSKRRAAAPDILNDVLANGGHIQFHTGSCTRRFITENEILEEGFWDAEDGLGRSVQIPYRFVAIMGDPLPKSDLGD